jgi:hypothetical protein
MGRDRVLRGGDWELPHLASQHPDRVKTLAELWEKQTQAFTEMVQSGAGVFS